MDIEKPASHLDHLVRQTRDHHVQLSTMADMKANMMLTVASLMIPLSIQYLAEPMFRLAALIMVCSCVITVILSAYAAMPKIQVRRKSAPDGNHAGNPLFFGTFMTMDYQAYLTRMEGILNDHNRTYEVQLREIYEMGAYLANQKYRFVRSAYVVFILGVVVSTSVYVVQSMTS